MNLYTRHRRQVAPGARDREVYGIRYYVAKVEDVQRTIVGDDGGLLPDSEPGGKNLLPRRLGILSETVEASSHPREAPALGMVCQ